jgi:hypothetical protein
LILICTFIITFKDLIVLINRIRVLFQCFFSNWTDSIPNFKLILEGNGLHKSLKLTIIDNHLVIINLCLLILQQFNLFYNLIEEIIIFQYYKPYELYQFLDSLIAEIKSNTKLLFDSLWQPFVFLAFSKQIFLSYFVILLKLWLYTWHFLDIKWVILVQLNDEIELITWRTFINETIVEKVFRIIKRFDIATVRNFNFLTNYNILICLYL